MKIQIKKIQTMKDHDGGAAFSADVYLDGKNAGHIIEDCWGGGLQVNIKKADQERMVTYIKTLPIKDPKWHGDLEIFLEDLVNHTLSSRELKRKLKKPMAYEKGNENLGITEFNCKWGEPFNRKPWSYCLADLKKRNPNHIFLNEMPFDEALKVWSPEPEIMDDGPPLVRSK